MFSPIKGEKQPPIFCGLKMSNPTEDEELEEDLEEVEAFTLLSADCFCSDL